MLIAIFLILFSILSHFRLNWAVLFLMAALPSYLIRFNVGLPTTLLETMIIIVFLVWLLKNFKSLFGRIKTNLKNKSLAGVYSYPFGLEMIALLIISLAAVIVSGSSNSAFGIWKAYFFEPILLSIVIINIFRPKDFIKIIGAFLISAFCISALAIYQKFTGHFIANPFWAAAATRRATSFFPYPNAIGLFLTPLILIFWGTLMAKAKTWRQNIWLVLTLKLVIIMSIIAIIFAKSLGAALGIASGLIIFGVLASKKSRYATITFILLAVLITGAITPLRHQAMRYLTLNDFSGQVRKSQWNETWQMLQDGRLIFGAGLNGYQKALAPYHLGGFFYDNGDPDFHRNTVFNAAYRAAHWQPLEIYLYPHNIILNFWTELGLAGLILFIWIIVKFYLIGSGILFKNYKLKIKNYEASEIASERYLTLGLISAMTAIIMHGLVDVPYFKNDLAVFFWILLSLVSILQINHLQKHD